MPVFVGQSPHSPMPHTVLSLPWPPGSAVALSLPRSSWMQVFPSLLPPQPPPAAQELFLKHPQLLSGLGTHTTKFKFLCVSCEACDNLTLSSPALSTPQGFGQATLPLDPSSRRRELPRPHQPFPVIPVQAFSSKFRTTHHTTVTEALGV